MGRAALFIRLAMLDHVAPATGVLLLTFLGAAIVIPAVLLVISTLTGKENDVRSR